MYKMCQSSSFTRALFDLKANIIWFALIIYKTWRYIFTYTQTHFHIYVYISEYREMWNASTTLFDTLFPCFMHMTSLLHICNKYSTFPLLASLFFFDLFSFITCKLHTRLCRYVDNKLETAEEIKLKFNRSLEMFHILWSPLPPLFNRFSRLFYRISLRSFLLLSHSFRPRYYHL